MKRARFRPSDEATVLRAWQDQLTAAVQTPWLARELGQRGSELLPRFAEWYGRLQALPRRTRRVLQRRLALPLASVALLLTLGQGASLAATIAVDETMCTLADAITAANTDTATGGCAAGSGADTLVLPPGSTQMLTDVDNTTYSATGLPVINSEITITGQGATITRASSAPDFRMLAVGRDGDLTLQEVTIIGGRAVAREDGRLGQGGGMASYGSPVIIENSIISGNTAVQGGGVSVRSFFLGEDLGYSSLTITNSTISGNTAAGNGGGVYALQTSSLTIANSTITDNTSSCSTCSGGGINIYEGNVNIITNSTISGNTARIGGGVFNSLSLSPNNISSLTITNSTISGNTARMGAAVSYGGGVFGGPNTTTTITNSTISGNTAADAGGGVSIFSGSPFIIANSTITGNMARSGGGVSAFPAYGPVSGSIAHTIVSGNMADAGHEIFVDATSNVTANNFNLFGFNADAGVVGVTPGPTDIVPGAGVQVSAILDPTLTNNGGPTETHALVFGSPAIDAGSAACPPPDTDQRGVPRPQDGDGDGTAVCDIGAFELAAAAVSSDLNRDGCVDRSDLTSILAAIRSDSQDLSFDLNGDGDVNIADARTLVTLFTNPRGEPCE